MRMNWGLLVGKAGEELDIEDKQNMQPLQYLVSDYRWRMSIKKASMITVSFLVW